MADHMTTPGGWSDLVLSSAMHDGYIVYGTLTRKAGDPVLPSEPLYAGSLEEALRFLGSNIVGASALHPSTKEKGDG